MEHAKQDEKLLQQEAGEQSDAAGDEPQQETGMAHQERDDPQAQSSSGTGDITLVA